MLNISISELSLKNNKFTFTATPSGCHWVNSLATGRSEYYSKNVIFNFVLLIGIFRSSYDNAFRWMPHDLTDDKSTLVQVMAWCRQASSYYLSQCWLSSLSPYGVARPQWVKEESIMLCSVSIDGHGDKCLCILLGSGCNQEYMDVIYQTQCQSQTSILTYH